MKDELNGNVMEEFVGLKAKMYSFCIAGKEEKKAKGIKKCVIKKRITHSDYREDGISTLPRIRQLTT